MTKSLMSLKFLKSLKEKIKDQRGEMATLLTIVSLGLMLVGVAAGTFVAQRETRTRGRAAEPIDGGGGACEPNRGGADSRGCGGDDGCRDWEQCINGVCRYGDVVTNPCSGAPPAQPPAGGNRCEGSEYRCVRTDQMCLGLPGTPVSDRECSGSDICCKLQQTAPPPAGGGSNECDGKPRTYYIGIDTSQGPNGSGCICDNNNQLYVRMHKNCDCDPGSCPHVYPLEDSSCKSVITCNFGGGGTMPAPTSGGAVPTNPPNPPVPGAFHLGAEIFTYPQAGGAVEFVFHVKFFSDGCDGDVNLFRNGGHVAGPKGWQVPDPLVFPPPHAGPSIILGNGGSATVSYRGTVDKCPNKPTLENSITCTVSVKTDGNPEIKGPGCNWNNRSDFIPPTPVPGTPGPTGPGGGGTVCGDNCIDCILKERPSIYTTYTIDNGWDTSSCEDHGGLKGIKSIINNWCVISAIEDPNYATDCERVKATSCLSQCGGGQVPTTPPGATTGPTSPPAATTPPAGLPLECFRAGGTLCILETTYQQDLKLIEEYECLDILGCGEGNLCCKPRAAPPGGETLCGPGKKCTSQEFIPQCVAGTMSNYGEMGCAPNEVCCERKTTPPGGGTCERCISKIDNCSNYGTTIVPDPTNDIYCPTDQPKCCKKETSPAAANECNTPPSGTDKCINTLIATLLGCGSGFRNAGQFLPGCDGPVSTCCKSISTTPPAATTSEISGTVTIIGTPINYITIGQRLKGESVFIIAVDRVQAENGTKWKWNGAITGKEYEIKATMWLSTTGKVEAVESDIKTVTAPQTNINLVINNSATTPPAGSGGSPEPSVAAYVPAGMPTTFNNPDWETVRAGSQSELYDATQIAAWVDAATRYPGLQMQYWTPPAENIIESGPELEYGIL